jgi:hypothetical protein
MKKMVWWWFASEEGTCSHGFNIPLLWELFLRGYEEVFWEGGFVDCMCFDSKDPWEFPIFHNSLPSSTTQQFAIKVPLFIIYNTTNNSHTSIDNFKN